MHHALVQLTRSLNRHDVFRLHLLTIGTTSSKLTLQFQQVRLTSETTDQRGGKKLKDDHEFLRREAIWRNIFCTRGKRVARPSEAFRFANLHARFTAAPLRMVTVNQTCLQTLLRAWRVAYKGDPNRMPRRGSSLEDVNDHLLVLLRLASSS